METVTKGSNDLFYLLVPDSIKEYISIEIENGRFEQTTNDSIVRMIYIPGMRYEVLHPADTTSSVKGIKAFVNGPSQHTRNEITVEFVDRREGKTILRNAFLYREH
jgi:hypothetical protein